jgi:hypothetical protein
MNTQNRVSKILCAAYLLTFTAGLWADGSPEEKPYIGVVVKPDPISPLLRKHLHLQPDEGLLVVNVQQDSPGDRAGLEKDDIVLRIEDQPVTHYEQFVADIRRHEVGDTITLEIIHLGQRKEVSLALAPRGRGAWKYEVQQERQYRPGRTFEWEPGDECWHAIPFEDFQPRRGTLKQHGSQYREHQYFDDGDQQYEITIEGAPDDPETRILIETEGKTIEATVADLDQLEEPYREIVRKMLDNAKDESALSFGNDDDLSRHFQFPDEISDFLRAQPPSFGFPPGWNRSQPSQRDPLIVPDEPASQLEERMRTMEQQFERQMREMKELMQQMQKEQTPKKNEKVKI